MAGMSLSTGLISGMDTGALVTQLMQIEANPQTLLKQRLSSTQSQATAYRAINTRFDALRTAAEAVTKDTAWSPVKANSSASSVNVTAGTGATTGSVTFTVDNVATAHSVVSAAKWTVTGTQTSADLAYGAGSIDVTVGGTTKSVTVGGTGSLADAVKAINADTSLKLSATAVKVSATEYRLQVTAKDTGAAAAFQLGTAGQFTPIAQGTDAKLTVGTAALGYTVTSATNTFAGLLDGASITVTEPASNVTVRLADDPAAVAAKVGSLVSAANSLLDAIGAYTKTDSSSAALKGDATLRQLSTQVLDTVTRLTGVTNSAATAGLQLTRDGKFTFDQEKFTAAIAADPALVRTMFTGTSTLPGPDAIAGNADDVTTATGIAGKLQALAVRASDSTTGMLTALATSKDSAAKDLESRIADWDIRLELRRTALNRQFTAMEKALGSLQNQSQWLSAQLAQLPSWSSSSKS
jgi:flagellar hook-associated protein 2